MCIMYGVILSLSIIAVSMMGMQAHADITPVSEITQVVINTQLYVDNERFDSYPIYYPDKTPSKPITGTLIQYAGPSTDVDGKIVLAEMNSTISIHDVIRDVRGAGAVILYGIDDWAIGEDTPTRTPAIRVSGADGSSLASLASSDVEAFVLYGPGVYTALEGARDVEAIMVSERVFAIVTSEGGAQVIDITDPAWPVPAQTIRPTDIGTYLDLTTITIMETPYAIIGGELGIEIINITNPYDSVLASVILDGDEFDTLREVQDIETFVQAGRTYAMATSYGDDGIQIIDITNPYTPLPRGSATDGVNGFEALRGAKGVVITEISNRLYAIVAGYGDGAIQLVDIINPFQPLPIGIYPNSTQPDFLSGATDVETVETNEGIFAIVTGHNDDAIQIINITTPTLPLEQINLVDGSGRYTGLAGATEIDMIDISGTMHAVITGTDDDAIQLISIDSRANIRHVSNTVDDDDYDFKLDRALGVDTVVINDTPYAIVAGHNSDGIEIIDLARPASPALVSGAFNLDDDELVVKGSWGVDIFAADEKTYAIVANYHDDAVQIIDITNPLVPQPVVSLVDGIDSDELGGATDVEVFSVNGKIYAAIASYEDDAIQILDITDPTSPESLEPAIDNERGFMALDGALDIDVLYVSGRVHAMVASYEEDAIQIMDLTNPEFSLPLGIAQRGVEFVRDDDFGREETEKVIGLDGPTGIDMLTVNDRVYGVIASQNDDVVLILDITNPTIPWPASYIFDGGSGFFTLDGASDVETVYVDGVPYGIITAKWDRGVQIIDLSDPKSPDPVSSIYDNTDGFAALAGANKAEILFSPLGTLVAVSSLLDDAVQIIDVSNPKEPLPVQHAFDRIDGFNSLKGADEIAVYLIGGKLYIMVAGVEDRAIQIMTIS